MTWAFPPPSYVVLWLMATLSAVAALSLLFAGERKRRNRRQLAALGWRPARLTMVTAVVAVAAVAVGFVAGSQLPATGRASTTTALAWSLLSAVVASWAVPTVIAAAVLSGHRRRLDGAVLLWLRRIRLFVASGRPISVAVLDAAELVVDPAFAPAAGAVNAAVLSGRDPLVAVAKQLDDSPTASLLRTVEVAERSGAAASQLLDRVLDRVVRAIDDRRREAIDRLGRSVATSAALLAVVASAVVMATVVMTLPSV